MHEIQDPRNQIDYEAGLSNDTMGKECVSCGMCLTYEYFRRDTSHRDGFRDQCEKCENSPKMSTSEHTARLHEMNMASEGTKRQRMDHQDELRDSVARIGRAMRHSDFLNIVQKLVPSLYITQGRIVGDLAVFQTAPCPQTSWDGKDFRYLFFCPTGTMPEFSTYEWDHTKDIAIKEHERGWRTVLLRLIRTGLLSETTCNRVFGRPEGPSSMRWHRSLYQYRNQTSAA